MVAPEGGMHGLLRGGMYGCSQGHVWLLGGMCVVAPGGKRGIRRDTEIRSMSGRYASYWNAFLFSIAFNYEIFSWRSTVNISPTHQYCT